MKRKCYIEEQIISILRERKASVSVQAELSGCWLSADQRHGSVPSAVTMATSVRARKSG